MNASYFPYDWREEPTSSLPAAELSVVQFGDGDDRERIRTGNEVSYFPAGSPSYLRDYDQMDLELCERAYDGNIRAMVCEQDALKYVVRPPLTGYEPLTAYQDPKSWERVLTPPRTTYYRDPSVNRWGYVCSPSVGVGSSSPMSVDEIVQRPSDKDPRFPFAEKDEPMVQEHTAAPIILEEIAPVVGTEAAALPYVPMVPYSPLLAATSRKVSGLSSLSSAMEVVDLKVFRDTCVRDGRLKTASVSGALLTAAVWCADVAKYLCDQDTALEIERAARFEDRRSVTADIDKALSDARSGFVSLEGDLVCS